MSSRNSGALAGGYHRQAILPGRCHRFLADDVDTFAGGQFSQERWASGRVTMSTKSGFSRSSISAASISPGDIPLGSKIRWRGLASHLQQRHGSSGKSGSSPPREIGQK